MHVNQQLREATADALSGSSLGTVDTNRGADLRDALLPAGIVGTATDQVEAGAKGGREKRTVQLTLTIVADGAAAELDDDLDALRVEAETALTGSDFGGIAHRSEHMGADLEMGTDEEGERWYAFYVLSWEVDMWTLAGDPETAL